MTRDRQRAMQMLQAAQWAFPELRIGQLITNATGMVDNFNISDAMLADCLREFILKHGRPTDSINECRCCDPAAKCPVHA